MTFDGSCFDMDPFMPKGILKSETRFTRATRLDDACHMVLSPDRGGW